MAPESYILKYQDHCLVFFNWLYTLSQHINLLTMANLYDKEKHRLRLYGEMLKGEINDHKNH